MGDSGDFQYVLKELLQFLNKTAASTERVVVHCSAGIGRTGTIIALSDLILVLEA